MVSRGVHGAPAVLMRVSEVFNRSTLIVVDGWCCCCAVSHAAGDALDQWDAQSIVQRINESLLSRGYLTWFDLTNMKGVSYGP